MNSDDKNQLLNDLRSGKIAIANALEGVGEELARKKTSPERWSILECMEHVAVAESYMFSRTTSSTSLLEPQVNSIREKAIRERGADRTRRMESPEAARPTGRFATLENAVEKFNSVRDEAIEFVETFDGDLRARVTEHPLIGTVNCYENLLIMAAHPLRHAKQIWEIREAVSLSAMPTAQDS